MQDQMDIHITGEEIQASMCTSQVFPWIINILFLTTLTYHGSTMHISMLRYAVVCSPVNICTNMYIKGQIWHQWALILMTKKMRLKNL